ncbi:MAG: hypothetical protein M1391_13625 [Bacteroidetes bacterium]|nr:hypothetical protein [Bacteroidota bacterium]
MKKKIFVVVISLVVLVLSSCNSNLVDPPIIPEIQPGRRDYEWTEYKLLAQPNETIMLSSIWGATPNDVWAVGPASLSQYGIWHFDGTTWKNGNSTPTFAQFSLWGSTADDIWMANTDGILWHNNGTEWVYNTRLQVNRYQNFAINMLWGISSNEIYAAGYAYNSYFNEAPIGGIFKFDGNSWKQIPLPKVYLNFTSIRKAKNGDFLLRVWDDSTSETKIMVWNGKEFRQLFSRKGIASIGVFNINDKTLFNIDQVVYSYEDDGTYKVWEDFTGTDYYSLILCSRNEKDFFVSSKYFNGIEHYNGIDLQLIYPTDLMIRSGFVLERDVFFILLDNKNRQTIMLHGHLKN